MTLLTPIEALENAVAHHKGEMPPALVARHTTLTLLRRVAVVPAGVGIVVGGLLVGQALSPSPNIEGCLASGATALTWITGFSLLAKLTGTARRAIASSTLRSFEAMQGMSALGAGGASVGVSALLTPAQKMLQMRERAEAEKADLKRAQKEARARARGASGDNDARDFDDA